MSLKSRRKLSNPIKMLRENNFQFRIWYLFEISNECKSRINTLKDLPSLKNNCLSWTLSQKVTRGYTLPKRGSKRGKKMAWDPTGDLGQVRGPGTLRTQWTLIEVISVQQAERSAGHLAVGQKLHKQLLPEDTDGTETRRQDQGTALGKTGLES